MNESCPPDHIYLGGQAGVLEERPALPRGATPDVTVELRVDPDREPISYRAISFTTVRKDADRPTLATAVASRTHLVVHGEVPNMDERRELLDLLLGNARESTADLARQTGMAESRVESLIEELETDGVVRGYRAIVDWNRVEGERVRAEVELNVELDRETSYDDIARRIAGYRQVESLRLVSGDFDFAVEIAGDSMRDVSQFIADEIAPIPEVTQTVTHYVMESYKEGGVEFRSGDDDDRLAVSP